MMKKAMMALVAAVMMSTNMAAQTDGQTQATPRQPQMDKTEMIKKHTEQMVKDYALDEQQAAALLALNTEYSDKMPMMMGPGPRDGQRGQQGEMRRPMRGQRPQNSEARPQRDEARPQLPDSVRPGRMQRPMGGRPGMNREEMRKVMEGYNEGLKKIFTDEQFKKYEETMNKRRQQMGRGGQRGRRPQADQQ